MPCGWASLSLPIMLPSYSHAMWLAGPALAHHAAIMYGSHAMWLGGPALAHHVGNHMDLNGRWTLGSAAGHEGTTQGQ